MWIENNQPKKELISKRAMSSLVTSHLFKFQLLSVGKDRGNSYTDKVVPNFLFVAFCAGKHEFYHGKSLK